MKTFPEMLDEALHGVKPSGAFRTPAMQQAVAAVQKATQARIDAQLVAATFKWNTYTFPSRENVDRLLGRFHEEGGAGPQPSGVGPSASGSEPFGLPQESQLSGLFSWLKLRNEFAFLDEVQRNIDEDIRRPRLYPHITLSPPAARVRENPFPPPPLSSQNIEHLRLAQVLFKIYSDWSLDTFQKFKDKVRGLDGWIR